MGKLGNRPLRGENKRPSPTAHRTAIFLPSQGARIEGTKPSVLDRLPCWGRWRGGSWGKRSGEAEGGLPLTPAPPPPPALGGSKAGGRWETGPCRAGASRAQAQDRPEPGWSQRLWEFSWGGQAPQERPTPWPRRMLATTATACRVAPAPPPGCPPGPPAVSPHGSPSQPGSVHGRRPVDPAGRTDSGQEFSPFPGQKPSTRGNRFSDQRERPGQRFSKCGLQASGSLRPFCNTARMPRPFSRW